MGTKQAQPMDFYIDSTNQGIPFIYDIYEMLIQEIDVLFSTDNTNVLCASNGWANLKHYIFATSISEGTLASSLSKLIYDECPSADGIDINVEIKFIHGTVDDIGIITVTIKEDSKPSVTKNYYIG